MGERKTFVFNTDWREVLRDYPAEVRLEVYEAIIDYVATGTHAELKPLSNMAFRFIKLELDYNAEKYNDTIVARGSSLGGKALAKRSMARTLLFAGT